MIKQPEQPKAYHDVTGSSARVVVCQGGTRSGKTYSILQAIVAFCYENPNQAFKIDIVRKTFTALADTAMIDFFEIITKQGYYREALHNKNKNTYRLFGNYVRFTGVDHAQKKRGAKRDILFINEANELTFDEFFQLNIRTRLKTIMDFNPSIEADHWIFSRVTIREDADLFITNYLDNPFLTSSEIREIELLKDTDPYYWSVFGMGEATDNPARIFTYAEIPEVPDGVEFLGYGLDFGFANSPTCLIGVYRRHIYNNDGELIHKDLILDEVVYGTGMTNPDLSLKFEAAGVDPHHLIIADNEDPKSIEELRRLGWRISKSKKPKDGIQWGISFIRQHRVFITRRSSNAQKEFRLYKYKQTPNGEVINDPVKKFDHVADAVRYVVIGKAYRGRYAVR